MAPAVAKAIDRATTWLLGRQGADGRVLDRDRENALAALALFESGFPITDPRFQRLIAYVMDGTADRTEFVARRAELLARALPRMSPAGSRKAGKILRKDLATLLENQRDDGVWLWEPGTWASMEATFEALQSLQLLQCEGYNVPESSLAGGVAALLRRRHEDGGWPHSVQLGQGGGTDMLVTVQALTVLAQVNPELCADRGRRNRRFQTLHESVRKALERSKACYHNWSYGDGPKDTYFYGLNYALGRLVHAVPMESYAETDLAKRWFSNILRLQKGDGHWETPRREDGGHDDRMATVMALYELAQWAKRPLVYEMVEDLDKAVLANRGLWNAVESVSLRAPRAMRYARARLGLDFDVYEDAPLLYVTIEPSFRLASKERENLGRYVKRGGMILAQAAGAEAVEAARRELANVWPELTLDPLGRQHPLWEAGSPLRRRREVLGIDDGVRTVALVLKSNVMCELSQGSGGTREDAFRLFDHVVRYALEGGLDPTREIDVPAPEGDAPAVGPNKLVSVGLLETADGTACSEVPYAWWPRVAELIPSKGGFRLLGPKELSCADSNLSLCDVACLAGRHGLSLTEQEAKNLREYLADGGFLLLEARLGDARFPRSAESLVEVLGLSMAAADGSSMLTGQFGGNATGFDVRQTHRRADGELTVEKTDLRVLKLDGNAVGLFSPLDLGVSATGIRCWGLRGYAPTDARRILANVILSRSASRE